MYKKDISFNIIIYHFQLDHELISGYILLLRVTTDLVSWLQFIIEAMFWGFVTFTNISTVLSLLLSNTLRVFLAVLLYHIMLCSVKLNGALD